MANQRAPQAQSGNATPSRLRFAVVALGFGAVLLVAGVGLWRRSAANERWPSLGDQGGVTAEIGESCANLWIVSTGGLNVEAHGGIPDGWRGRSIVGELTLTSRRPGGLVVGTFEATDGSGTVEVSGGIDRFFKASCTAWPA
jgi:hypothetical protein